MINFDYQTFFNGKLNSICHNLHFKFEAGTSRGILTSKNGVFFRFEHPNGNLGWGEAGPLPGLSPDYSAEFFPIIETLKKIHNEANAEKLNDFLKNKPAFKFAIELAFLTACNGSETLVFENDFTNAKAGIAINGLIWMGDIEFMNAQIEDKLAMDFRCLKIKIGALDFDTELGILKTIRKRFAKEDLQLRVDANGAFSPNDALKKLKELAKFDLHSIEQPIKQNQPNQMAVLCRNSPVPIALDEELIGISDQKLKMELLNYLKPQFVVLKPTLLGGLAETKSWIDLANNLNIGWWITSALESNIGLNAIAQFAANYNLQSFQGLGTGQLFTNNIPSSLEIRKGFLWNDGAVSWPYSIEKQLNT